MQGVFHLAISTKERRKIVHWLWIGLLGFFLIDSNMLLILHAYVRSGTFNHATYAVHLCNRVLARVLRALLVQNVFLVLLNCMTTVLLLAGRLKSPAVMKVQHFQIIL